MQPVIGITTSRTDAPHASSEITLNEVYVTALSRAGAIPLLIPTRLPDEDLTSLLDILDGVLFSGGGDIDPECYGNPIHPEVKNIDPHRDRTEITMLQGVIERKLPFFGICRGLQLINVALDGNLYEDIQTQRRGSLQHQAPDNLPRDQIIHTVAVDQTSQLFQIIQKNEIGVNSHHHQGVRKIGRKLEITAIAQDGLIEAFELKNYPFGLAVQWHPEWMPDEPAMQALFSAFVGAAAGQKQASAK